MATSRPTSLLHEGPDTVKSLDRVHQHSLDTQAAVQNRVGQRFLNAGGAAPALRALALATLGLSLATETVPFSLHTWAAAPDAGPGLLLLLLSQLLCIPALVVKRHQTASAWVLLGMLLAGIQLTAHGTGGIAPDTIIPGYWLVGPMVVSLCSLDRRRYRAFAAGGVAALVVQSLLLAWPRDWVQLSDLLWIVQPVVMVLIFGDTMIISAEARNRTLTHSEEARRAHEEQDLEERTRREAARVLHDHLLHALHAISHAHDDVTRQLAVDECRDADRQMSTRLTPTDAVRLEDLLVQDPMVARTGAEVTGSSDLLPRGVAEALAGAVHEALQNVLRHAQASRTTVQIDASDGTVAVAVADDGRGFDPVGLVTTRLGMRSSILARMDDVGGQARTISRPGHGTRVELRWPSPQGSETGLWNSAIGPALRRMLSRLSWPNLAAGLLMTAIAGPQLERPVAAVVSALVTLGIGCAAAARMLRRPLTRWWTALLLVAAAGSWLVNLWLLPQPPAYDYLLWMAWGASALVQLVVISSRLSRGVLTVLLWAALQLGGLWWRYGPEWMWMLSSTATAGAGECAISLFVIMIAQRAATQQVEALDLASGMRAATARLRMHSHLNDYWSDKVSQEAMPLVRDVAEGRVDLTDGEVRCHAAGMEATLRDELVLGPTHTTLIEELAKMRRSGWRFTSTLSQEDNPRALAAAPGLLALLGQPQNHDQPATLSAGPSGVQAVVVSPTPEQSQRWAEQIVQLGGSIHVDPEFVRLIIAL